jgi:predicted transcriptional regulator
MAAWRTSCPRLTIWEDAVDNGLVLRNQDPANGATVHVTEKGRSLLRQDGRI